MNYRLPIGMRLPIDVKEALDRAAKDDRRSTSSYAEKVLFDHLVGQGYLEKSGGQVGPAGRSPKMEDDEDDVLVRRPSAHYTLYDGV